MKTILFIIPALTGGGSERVMINIITNIDYNKFKPILAILKKEGPFLKDIPKNIDIIDLKCKRTRYSFLKVAKLIWDLKPDIMLSTLGHLNLLIAILIKILPSRICYIARESSTVSLRNKTEKYPWLYNILYRKIYKNFDKIICQSKGMKNDLELNFNINGKKIEVIHNPVDFAKIENYKYESDNSISSYKDYVVSAGRLLPHKGFDRLIKAFSLIKNSNLQLIILGEGEEKERLITIAKEANVGERVKLIGFQDNPFKYYYHAKLFLLGSYLEGFPNVVLEANACGIPAVCFKCPGVDEIISDGINGFVVNRDDNQLFADTVENALNYGFNKNEIIKLTKSKYDSGRIVKQYEDILESCPSKYF